MGVVLIWACSGETHSISTGLSVQQTLGCGVVFLAVHRDGSFKLFWHWNVAGDETEWLFLTSDTAKDEGTRRGVAVFLFGWTPVVTILSVVFCPLVGSDDFTGEDMASNSFVKEMQVFAKSESLVVSLRLRVFDVVDSMKVFVASWLTAMLLQGVLILSVFETGVLNWRFLIGVRTCGVPEKYGSDCFLNRSVNNIKWWKIQCWLCWGLRFFPYLMLMTQWILHLSNFKLSIYQA